jgi:hypothetical protein
MPLAQATPEHLRQFLDENHDLLSNPNHYFGAWVDVDRDPISAASALLGKPRTRLHLDVSDLHPSHDEAEAARVQRGEKSYWGFSEGKAYANGREHMKPLAERLAQGMERGAAWLRSRVRKAHRPPRVHFHFFDRRMSPEEMLRVILRAAREHGHQDDEPTVGEMLQRESPDPRQIVAIGDDFVSGVPHYRLRHRDDELRVRDEFRHPEE